jgi:hypothetical protein
MTTSSPTNELVPPNRQHGMRHRSYRGKLLYLSDGVGEMGREYFSVTVQPDGERTLRAQCEMDNDRLLRDVTLTLDGDWRPRDAFLRLTVEEKLVGSSWFRFTDTVAECEGFTAKDGRISQKFDRPAGIECFGTHALHNDAWLVARLHNYQGDLKDFALWTFASSILANGGSGPELIPLEPGFSKIHDLGSEMVTVPAGSFETCHVRIDIPGVDDFEIWAHGEDSVPVRLRSHTLKQSYELVELEGDVH